MIEEINYYLNNSHRTNNENLNQQQEGISNVQVDQISKFLLECPEAALNVQKYLQKNYSNQQKFNQPINSTPKRDHSLDDSGRSSNNGNDRQQRPRKRFQQNKEKDINAAQQSTTQFQQQSILSPSNVQQGSGQNVNQHKRIAFD
ncbi:unnamed protein product [Rotaria sordida]|uniref:Uncharacterized protein n=1 Tax=Rotaria sordida TaxID=392033 RepID=A0A815GV77_9BILA|nr:unnamed protein product [Rotaria sordida]CAF1343198.1 unnamed protein product [Rotaria sordida]CAF3703508.1 unnamed protein product [Rotaria sordida]CAF4063051.1 unnamed protein product [Rotaria sordida]